MTGMIVTTNRPICQSLS